METISDSQAIQNPRPNVTPVKIALKWGLIAGAVMILLSLISYYAGMMQNAAIQWLSYILLALGIFFGVRHHRDKELGGYISFGRGLGTGVLISLFAGILLSAFILLFYGVIDPGALEELKRLQEEGMYEKGMSDEQIDMSLKFVNPGFMAMVTLPMMTFFGFIISLVIAAILKRNKPLFIEERE
ncbi:uncharacterized protein DUF4199 [Anseongella ginsenosidimutans]|uniref:Uncharacterized protein DUF4199 n=1 Tax=Anseongella ginsenosidimutans TaxID=496056 RepID=A0A4V2UTY5_9SPHI|nr:DUF4199 domain-containing protein [Anseongella ginsenosidimutans]QEC53401.1 DUF4199 domain-containing protein [Anseongella ginsenosidimutans]TCS88292.1 uncharacterized protein DUF4199 [Anseongella ginsenosidimutans]